MRAIAVLAVIVFHAFPRSLPGGFTGVDVFFVISGFLISSIILTGLERRTFTFRGFYARRVARIFPALVVVLAASLVAGWLIMLATEYRQLGRHVAASGAFAANVVFWREAGYFDSMAKLKPLLHLWSIGVEEQFYLVWPPLLWLAARRRLGVPLVIGTLAVLSFATNIASTRLHQSAAFYLPFGRLWELLIGALLAYLALEWRDPVEHPDPMSLVGLSFIVAGFLTAQAPAFPGWWALLPTLGTVMLIAAGPDAFINRHVLSRRALVFIGLISYPLYLWHWPALSFARHMLQPGAALTVALVVASGLLAWITYLVIERPIRFAPASLARFRAPGLASAMIVLTSAGLVVGRNVIPPMLDSRFRFLSNYTYDHEAAYRGTRCHLNIDQTERDFQSSCADTGFGAPRRMGVFLWGDSHAAHLYPGLRSLATERQLSLAQFTADNCAPLVRAPAEFCARVVSFVLDRVSLLEPDVVVLASLWSEDHLERVQRTVAELRSRGVKRVVVVGPVPKWEAPLPRVLIQYMRAHPRSPQPERMRLDLSVPRAIEARLRAAIGSTNVRYVSAIDVFCRGDECLTTLDGRPTSWDTAHLTDAASRLLAREVLAVLDTAGGS